MEQKINNFTEGPILGPLLRFSLPVLLALLLQSLYGAVDLLIVGKFAATQDVSGIPIAWLMSVKVGTLFSIGLSVPLSTLSQIIMCFIFFAILKKKEQTHPAAP